MADQDDAAKGLSKDKQTQPPFSEPPIPDAPDGQRTVINLSEADKKLREDYGPESDAPQGFGPTFDPSPDPTVIAPDQGESPQPAIPATVVGDIARAAPVAPAKLVEPGTLINNNYRIEELISVGGMGEVYRAVNVYTGDPVAVKVILPDLARDQQIIDLFRREARVLVQLRDEAIVSYHNFVLDQGLNRYCLIMEFVEGKHLGSMLNGERPMPDEQAVSLMRRLARGLGQAHARGVTHRDLSPDNVILRNDRVDEAVLIDFGIARSTELGDGLEGRFAGKFKYIAPEQLGHFEGTIGPQTDIYGLALLVTAMLRGKPLDMGDSVVSASDARRDIPDLTGLSHRMFPLLQHMLEPDPQQRPANMGQIVAMLDDPMRIPARYRLPLWTGNNVAETPIDPLAGISETPFGLPVQEAQAGLAANADSAASRRWPLFIAPLLVAVLASAAAIYWLQQNDAAIPEQIDPPIEQAAQVPALPPRDPASRDGFLAEQTLGPCAMARRLNSGPQAGTIAIWSAAPVDGTEIQNAYDAAFGTHPAVTPRRVNDAQCPAVEFTGALAGRTAAPPEIRAVAQATATGFQTEADITQLDERNLWLALIAPDGSVYDLTTQSTLQSDGSVHVAASVDEASGPASADEPYLLLAVASSASLVSVAAAPAGAASGTLMPSVLEELQSDGDAAAASLALISPVAMPEAISVPEAAEE